MDLAEVYCLTDVLDLAVLEEVCQLEGLGRPFEVPHKAVNIVG